MHYFGEFAASIAVFVRCRGMFSAIPHAYGMRTDVLKRQLGDVLRKRHFAIQSSFDRPVTGRLRRTLKKTANAVDY